MQITSRPKCGTLYETTIEAANEPLWMNAFGARHQWCGPCVLADKQRKRTIWLLDFPINESRAEDVAMSTWQ